MYFVGSDSFEFFALVSVEPRIGGQRQFISSQAYLIGTFGIVSVTIYKFIADTFKHFVAYQLSSKSTAKTSYLNTGSVLNVSINILVDILSCRLKFLKKAASGFFSYHMEPTHRGVVNLAKCMERTDCWRTGLIHGTKR